MILFIVNHLTTRLSGWKPVNYRNLTEAINGVNNMQSYNVLKDYWKMGHLEGAGLAAFGTGAMYISSKLDSGLIKATSLFYGFALTALGLVGLGVTTFGKNKVEQEMKNSVKDNMTVQQADPNKGFSRLIGSSGLKSQLESFIQHGIPEQRILHLKGPYGTGKTYTCSLLANELVSRGIADKGAEFWDVREELVTPTDADKWSKHAGKAVFKVLGANVDGETITQKVERVLSDAVAESQNSGKTIVVCFNEADQLIRGSYEIEDGTNDGGVGRTGAERDFGRIVNDVLKLKGTKAKVVVCMTSNLLNTEGFIQQSGRLYEVELERPDKESIKEFIKLYLKDFGVAAGDINNISNLDELSELSQADMFKILHDVHHLTKSELSIAGYKSGTLSPIFNYRKIQDYIGAAVIESRSSNGTKTLDQCLKEKLTSYRDFLLNQGIKDYIEEVKKRNNDSGLKTIIF